MTGLEGALEPEVLPATRPAAELEVDVGRGVRRWWRQQDLGDVVDETSLAQALSDVGVLSLAYLAQALTDPKVKAQDKLKIALTMSPKLVAEARGRLRGTASPTPTDGESAVGGLLESYGVKARSG